jgi:hypothetical protein
MERFWRAAASFEGMEAGRLRERKCVRRLGTRVVRTENQWAERRVRSCPLAGMP